MSYKGFVSLVFTIASVFILLIGLFVFTERVPEGKVAVVYSPSGGATEVLDPGWHMIGLFEKTQEYPTRITIVKTKISVTTEDGKKITMPARYEMKVDKSKVLSIFKELGSQDIEQIQEGYLYQKLFKASRDTISGYSVLDIFGTKTTEASAKVTEKMADTSKDLGFIITDVTLGNPEVDSATQNAIDARVQAAQQLEKLNLDKQIAEAEAEKAKIEAEGNAAAKIEEARGTAEANKLLERSITDKVLQKMYIEKWNGKLPQVQGEGATPFINLK